MDCTSVTSGPGINQLVCINLNWGGHGVVEHHNDVAERFISQVFNDRHDVAAYNDSVMVVK